SSFYKNLSKFLFLFCAYSLLSSSIIAQTLYGTNIGNIGNIDYNAGTIIKYEASTRKLTTPYTFTDAGYEHSELFQASNGKLYGMNQNNASLVGYGTLFSLDPASS